MKKIKLLIICLVTLLSCNCQNNSNRRSIVDAPAIDTTSYAATDEDAENEVTEGSTRETLNDIRFDGWTKKEWADNDYIRAVRKYIDAYNKGEIENPDLDEYKDYMQGKFIIADIRPCIVGGAFIYFSFYDYPDKVFAAMVYSDVDEKTRVVSNYECRSLTYEDLDLKITQDEIRQFLKECPEQKMW
jgi:hypothetical protein